MKKMFAKLFVLAVFLGLVGAAFAQSYPYTTPTYIPNAVLASQTLSAPGSIVFNASGINTVAVDLRGTCTNLAGFVEGSVDGVNYIQLNVFPITTSTITATSAVPSTVPAGYRSDVAGMQKVRVRITALSAACAITVVGSEGAFTGTY